MKKEERELKRGEKAYFQRVINDFNREAKLALDEIEKLKKEIILGKSPNHSIEQVEKFKDEIIDLYEEIIEVDQDGVTIADKVEAFKSGILEQEKEIEELKNKIEKYTVQLYGKQDDNGVKSQGIVNKIDKIQKQLVENLDKNEKKQNALLVKIEELLNGASTVALSKAFGEHKTEFIKPNIIWSIVFVSTLLIIMGFSVVSFFASGAQISEMWKITLGNLPFIGGGVWLAIFSSKQRSQNIRLQQEYAFKEDVAKLYYGLKSEIDQLGESDLGKKLNESVISILVETVSYNPSQTLDNQSHSDKGPILEALKNITETLKVNQ